MKHVDIYLAADAPFHDMHPKDRIVAYLFECDGKQFEPKAFNVRSSFGNRAALLGLLAALRKFRHEAEIEVHADCIYLVSQINRGNIYRWMDSKGTRYGGSPIRYHDEWMEVLAIINAKCSGRIKANREMSKECLEVLKNCISDMKEPL